MQVYANFTRKPKQSEHADRNETNLRIVSTLPTQSKTIMRWRASFICTNKSIRTIGMADTGQLFSVMLETKRHAGFVACSNEKIIMEQMQETKIRAPQRTSKRLLYLHAISSNDWLARPLCRPPHSVWDSQKPSSYVSCQLHIQLYMIVLVSSVLTCLSKVAGAPLLCKRYVATTTEFVVTETRSGAKMVSPFAYLLVVL